MQDRTRDRIRFVATIGVGVAMFAVLAAPLPGEVSGCGGDTSGKINASDYCYERCAVEAQRLRTCGEIPDSDVAQELQEEHCADRRQCQSPMICVGWSNYHISNEEATQCMNAILSTSCDVNIEENLPSACTEAELCDPN